jgi:peptidyl-dipeptidase Dcp
MKLIAFTRAAAGLIALGCAGNPPAAGLEPAPTPTMAETDAAAPTPAYEAMLAEWKGPHGGVPPFDAIDDEQFVPAFDRASELWLAEVAAIANAAEPPTFDNTLVALERSGKPLDRVSTLFFTMAANRNTPKIQELAGIIRPKLSAVADRVYFDAKLFARIAAVHESRQTSGLKPEQVRLVENQYDEFVRRGAKLDAAKKERMGAINERLAKLFTDFGNRVQADEDTWVALGDKDLAGLPPPMVASYKAAAQERKLEGYAVVNTRSAVDPFLTFSERRDLREKVWRAFVNRGDNGGPNDTNALITEIVALRAERAKLLGYQSHAHWRMSDTMAKDPARARELMLRVWPAARARVKEEVRDMLKFARKDDPKIAIEPWDYRYYMEKVRKAKYALDQNEFKNYFELDNMIRASYYMAERLYGYAFEEITGTVPVFHPDVRVYRVTRKQDGAFVGLLYRDDFARQYKRSGAWQATYRAQHKVDRKEHAIASNNNNFTKGAAGKPVLISLDDAETLFHEFGHALHALTNDVTYPSLGVTPRDFVEFPSQVHENWVLTREILDEYARHHETKEKMPQALIDKMRAASKFNQGFATVEYLAAALVDMDLHTDPEGKVDPDAFERKALAAIGMPKEIVLRHRLPQFLHLFTSDAYSAGYYSYLWSDVMAADAWKAFEDTGDPWHPATAAKFKSIILATGDSIDRAEAYRQFRGRDPEVEALLENRGFPTK